MPRPGPFRCLGVLALACPTLSLAATFDDGVALERAHRPDAAAQAFRDVLARDPQNAAAKQQLAILTDLLQRYDESAALWRELIAARPDEAAPRLGLARTLMDQGDVGGAQSTLDAALQQRSNGADDEYDALTLRGDIAAAQGHDDSARAYYESARDLPQGAGDTELAGKIARLPERLSWRLDFAGIADHYSHDRGTESGYLARASYDWPSGQVVYLRLDRLEHFDTVDTTVSAGAFLTPTDALSIQLEAGVCGDPEFSPEESGLIDIGWTQGWIEPLIGYRYLNYPVGHIGILSPGVRLIDTWFGEIEARYARSRDIGGTHSGIASLRSSWRMGDRQQFMPYVSGSVGHDTLPPEPPAHITRLGTGVSWSLTRRYGLRFDYAYENRRHDYILHSASLGFSMNF